MAFNLVSPHVETCPQCGGNGGEPGSNFGDYGWHPCFFCGASGVVPEGTAQREAEAAAELAAIWTPPYNDAIGCMSDDGRDDAEMNQDQSEYQAELADYLELADYSERIPF